MSFDYTFLELNKEVTSLLFRTPWKFIWLMTVPCESLFLTFCKKSCKSCHYSPSWVAFTTNNHAVQCFVSLWVRHLRADPTTFSPHSNMLKRRGIARVFSLSIIGTSLFALMPLDTQQDGIRHRLLLVLMNVLNSDKSSKARMYRTRIYWKVNLPIRFLLLHKAVPVDILLHFVPHGNIHGLLKRFSKRSTFLPTNTIKFRVPFEMSGCQDNKWNLLLDLQCQIPCNILPGNRYITCSSCSPIQSLP